MTGLLCGPCCVETSCSRLRMCTSKGGTNYYDWILFDSIINTRFSITVNNMIVCLLVSSVTMARMAIVIRRIVKIMKQNTNNNKSNNEN